MRITQEQRNMRQAVYEFLSKNPERHEQESVWGKNSNEFNDQSNIKNLENFYSNCNTNMCIAGATLLFDGLNKGKIGGKLSDDWVEKAAGLLGLDEDKAYDLFHTMDEKESLKRLKRLAYGN